MGRKIFISYKFSDSSVRVLDYNPYTTVRSYVDKIESFCDKTDHIYKAESNNDDLSHLSDDQIWEKLKDRIFDSSVTIVMISPNMKESGKRDKSQWIPWEISYSLKEMTRNDIVSRSNAILAVVLPDSNGSYEYYLKQESCCSSGCRRLETPRLFYILRKNMFNLDYCTTRTCDDGSKIYYGNSSYIESVRWCDFIESPNTYIEKAVSRKDKIANYTIEKEVGNE